MTRTPARFVYDHPVLSAVAVLALWWWWRDAGAARGPGGAQSYPPPAPEARPPCGWWRDDAGRLNIEICEDAG